MSTKQAQRIYEFGPFRVDGTKRLLLRDGQTVPLTSKCFDILLTLVENSGEVISKDTLISRVWPDSFVEEGNLTYSISILRKALGERAGEHQYIATVPGRGYQFVATVRAVPSDSSEEPVQQQPESSNGIDRKEPAPEPRDTRAQQQQGTRSNQAHDATHFGRETALTRISDRVLANIRQHKLILIAPVLTVVALISARGYFPIGRSEQKKPISSIAVLPLANLSGDPDAEYISDGISGSLINTLSQLPGLKVIARNSTLKYKGKDIDPQELARLLQVEALLMGSVTQRGDNLLIDVELMDVRDRTHIWGERFNRKMANLLAFQADISREIASNLRLKLTDAQQQQLGRRETTNAVAYHLLLKARFTCTACTSEAVKKSIEYINQAIDADPKYASAYAELSKAYIALMRFGVLNPKEYAPKAEAATQKALELDDGLADAHLALANRSMDDWNWQQAETEYKRAIQLNPSHAEARSWHAIYLSVMGQHELAIAESNRVKELDPLSSIFNAQPALALYLARHYDEAIDALKKTLELDQPFNAYEYLGYNYAAKGMYADAIAAYQKSIALGDDSPSRQIYLGAAYARAGRLVQAQSILKRLRTSKEYFSPCEMAILLDAVGERERAFASLEQGLAAHDLQAQFLGCDPAFDPLRSDPRFQDLIRRVGLPQ